MSKVEWKDTEWCDNYQISTLGQLRNKKTGLHLRTNNNGTGYLMYHLHNGRCQATGKRNRKALLVHRLVAQSFIRNPSNKLEVNHIDGNKLNNVVTNLEWCTRQENTDHAIKMGLRATGTDLPHTKLTAEKVKLIREIRASKYSDAFPYSWLGKAFGVSLQHIGDIVSRRRWSYVD